VSANGDGKAGFAIFVQGTLQVTDASPAGHGVSKFRGKAVACYTGLQAVLILHVTMLARESESSLTPSRSSNALLKVQLGRETPHAAPYG